MNILKNLLIVVVLSAVAWWLYSHFNEPNRVVPPSAQEEASLPFVYQATTTTYRIAVESISATSNKTLNDAVRSHIEARIAEFDATYRPEALSPKDLEILGFANGDMQYEMMISAEYWSIGTINGMVVQEYAFTGGAHGGVTLTTFAYDSAGNEVQLDDLFADGSPYLERIAEAVIPRLKVSLEQGGMFNQEMFDAGTKAEERNYSVFSLDDSTITFYFNQYQVAPYAAGILTTTVPLSEFDAILSPNYF